MSFGLTSATTEQRFQFTWHMFKKFIVNDYFYKSRIIRFDGVKNCGVTN